jgi:hypothetical protein
VNKKETRSRPELSYETDLIDFKNINVGKKCFVVGAGPSLFTLNLSEIFKHVVISVNSSALLMDWKKEPENESSRFWISTDPLCIYWDYFWSHVVKQHCTRIVRTSWRQHAERIKYYSFRFFEPRKTYVTLDPDDGGLCSYSSVLAAIDFAIWMNCKEIYLLGVDHRFIQNKTHFWQFQSKNLWPRRSDKDKFFIPAKRQQVQVFLRNIDIFKLLQIYAEKKNSIIYNCSNLSNINIFPKKSLDEALQ